jgi:hypothetical protein
LKINNQFLSATSFFFAQQREIARTKVIHCKTATTKAIAPNPFKRGGNQLTMLAKQPKFCTGPLMIFK